jgi:hypothetical protein
MRNTLTVFLTLFLTATFSFADVTVGNGTSTGAHLPIEPYYGYSYSQVIYLQSEIYAAGDITHLSWNFAGSSLSNSNNWTIYMGHTSKSAFTSDTDWFPVASLTQVWSGTFTDPGASGWVTFDITDFTYNNTDNLIIAVDENADFYDGSGDDFYCTSVATSRAIYYYNDDTNPDPVSPPTGTLSSYIANIKFSGITQSCPFPSDLTASNFTTTSADLSWTENGSATTWDIELGLAGFTPTGTPTQTGVTSNPYTYAGLNPSSSYAYYVRSDCGGGDYSPWIGPYEFNTACGAPELPYTESFEISVSPNCWTQTMIIDNGFPSPTWVLRDYYNPPHGLYEASLVASTGSQARLETPNLNFSGKSGVAVTFYMYHDRDTYARGLQIQANNGSGWSDVGTTIPYYNGSTGWMLHQVSLSAFDDESSVSVGFWGKAHGVDIDYVTVDEVSCLAPSSLSVTDIFHTSATASWTEQATATTWDIELVPDGSDPTGTPTYSGVTSNPYDCTGLTPNTAYGFYVRADCGGSDYSTWVGPYNFTTACYQTVPLTESFETSVPPSCWSETILNDQGYTTFEWYKLTSSSAYDETGIASCYFTIDDLPGASSRLETPVLDLSGKNNVSVRYYMYHWGTAPAENTLQIQANNGSGWTNVGDPISPAESGEVGTWLSHEIDLSAYDGDPNVQIGLLAYLGSSDGSNNSIDIDYVTIDEVSCIQPYDLAAANITKNSADLSWTEFGTATTWDIELVTAGSDPTGIATQTGITSNPYTYSGLDHSSQYDFYVRSHCDGGGYSNWAGPYRFATPFVPPAKALEFDGSNDYVKINDSNSLDVSAVTMEMWFKQPTAALQFLCAKASENLEIHLNSTGAIRFIPTNGIYIDTPTGAYTGGEWTHVACVYDPGNSIGKVYVNGIEKVDYTISFPAIPVTTTEFDIARRNDGSYYFGGQIDEFRIWDDARTETEIQENMGKVLTGTEEGLVAYYKFDSTLGKTLSDASGNSNTGTLYYMDNSDWVTSTAPVGEDCVLVASTTPTSLGSTGQQIQATITAGGDASNYLLLYRTGDGDGEITGETFPGSLTGRANILWGVEEFGDITADLLFDYSGVSGITYPANVLLLKRTTGTDPWTDISSQFTHNTGSRTFSGSGFTSFSDFSIGEGEGALPVELQDFYAEVVHGGIQLYWKTASEMNNMGFKIYRKDGDLPGFRNLEGLIEGAGTISEPQDYNFTDKDVQADILYTYQIADVEEGTNKETLHPAITIMATKEALQAQEIPQNYKLHANYPNPFNPTTIIEFDMPESANLTLKIYDITGKLIRSFADGEAWQGGSYSIVWNGDDNSGKPVSSGTYLCKMVTEKYKEVKQLVLLK